VNISELFQASQRFKTDNEWLVESKFFDRVDSTQKRAPQFLPKSGEGAVLILAESQTKGVGRQGRTWVSPPGGIWFTLALPLKKMSLADAAPFSIVSAYLILKALQEINNLKCEFKWPNDIQYKGKKLAGIILGTTTKFKKGWMLIGVGVNVNNDLPAELAKTATSIKIIRGQTQGRSRLIESVISSLWTAWGEFDRTGFGPYQKGVEGVLLGVGKTARIHVGKTEIQSTISGIDPQGGLLLESPSGTKTIHAGEIVGQPT